MKSRYVYFTMAGVLAGAFLQGCGGGEESPTNTGALDASSVSNASDTFNALEGLLDSIDEGSSTSKLSTQNTLVSNGPPVGSPSLLGCHMNTERKRIFGNVKEFGIPLCYIANVEKADIGFTVPEGDYAHYKILEPTHPGDAMLLRIKKDTDADGNRCLRFQGCRDGAQNQDFRLCETTGGVNARVSHQFIGRTADNQDISGLGSIELTATGTSAEALDTLSLTAAFEDGFGAGSAQLDASRADLTWSILGFFGFSGDQFSNSTGICGYAGEGKGSGHVLTNAEFPPFTDPNDSLDYCPDTNDPFGTPVLATGPSCSATFEVVESFELDTTSGSLLVIDNADALPYSDLAANCTLPTAAEAPAGYEEDWDCTAPDGFTEIDISEADITACQALEAEREASFQSHESCEQKFQEDKQSAN